MASSSHIHGPCCYIVPPHVLEAIASSDATSEDSKAAAEKTLRQIAAIRSTRNQIQATFAQAAGAPHPPRQGIVPFNVFQAILDSEDASDESKQQAQNHLNSLAAIADAKVQPAKSGTGASPPHLFRTIYDCRETHLPRTKKLFTEGAKLEGQDPYAVQVYNNFGSSFEFYYKIFNRNSKKRNFRNRSFVLICWLVGLDNKGLNLIGCVHFDDDDGRTKGYDNAFWDGKQMCFGDGDARLFNTFTESLDITGHELTHGVVSYTANLPYWFQSGALNESMADVFGSMIKQYKLNQTAKEADWLIGAGLFRSNVNARALRDMANPGTAYKDNPIIGSDPQPKDMDGYVVMTENEDEGGVHINSSIPNRAFYLVATAVGKYSWDVAGKIWYATLTDSKLANVTNTKTTFKLFADLTVVHAEEFGAEAVTAVKKAWTTVKVFK